MHASVQSTVSAGYQHSLLTCCGQSAVLVFHARGHAGGGVYWRKGGVLSGSISRQGERLCSHISLRTRPRSVAAMASDAIFKKGKISRQRPGRPRRCRPAERDLVCWRQNAKTKTRCRAWSVSFDLARWVDLQQLLETEYSIAMSTWRIWPIRHVPRPTVHK